MSQPIYDKNDPHTALTPELGYILIMAIKGRHECQAKNNSRMLDKFQHIIDNVTVLIEKEK
jgi:hypothetical protein